MSVAGSTTRNSIMKDMQQQQQGIVEMEAIFWLGLGGLRIGDEKSCFWKVGSVNLSLWNGCWALSFILKNFTPCQISVNSELLFHNINCPCTLKIENILRPVVVMCCVTNSPNTQQFKTAHIYLLTVSMGQEFRAAQLSGSDSGSLPRSHLDVS